MRIARLVVASLIAIVPLTAASLARAQTCVQPPTGLIAWWPLDGTADDIVGYNNPSSVNGVSYQQGQVLQGATFSQAMPTPGTGIRIPQGTLTPAKFTVDAWVRISGPGPDGNGDYHGAYIIAKPWSAYWPAIALTWVASNYRFRFEFGNWGLGTHGFIDTASAGAVGPVNYGPDGLFHHVVGTYDGTYYRLYVDGDLKGSHQDTTPVSYDPSTPWVIGANYFTNSAYRTFNGVIDEVEIFNRALDQSEIQKLYAAGPAGKCKPKGMTWIHSASNAQTGTITVGCSGCDAYHGDTPCNQQLPLLCIYKKTPFPLPPGVNNTNQYSLWSGGVVATTAPVTGNTFAGLSVTAPNGPNARCVAEFGPDWRVAEFHDGWGWNFQAYGGTVNAPNVPSQRFWVHIKDQPGAICWKQ